MRVLYVIGGGGLGGIERHVQCLVNNVDRMQITPFVCVVRKRGVVSDEMVKSGVPVFEIGVSNGHDLRIFGAFRKILSEVKPDLIHAHEMPLFLWIYLCLLRKYPLIVSIHCAFTTAPHLWFVKLMYRLLSNCVDLYLPVSQATWTSAKIFCNVADKQGRVFYNPIDLQDIPPKTSQFIHTLLRREKRLTDEQINSAKVFGMVGRMVEQKDWWSFLQVSFQVLSRDANAFAFAIGDGPQRIELERTWENICKGYTGVENRLIWLGFRADAKELIGGMDVFILTSRHEELPTTLLEAFAMRTMVVGFVPEGGVNEVIDLARGTPIGVFHEHRDVKTLADSVSEALDNAEFRNICTLNASALIGNCFDADKNCRHQLYPIYCRASED